MSRTLNSRERAPQAPRPATRDLRTEPTNQERAPIDVMPKSFRRLKWNELVISGDFIANEHRRLEPWEGPSGFRAAAFVRPIYRATKAGSTIEKPSS
jgi:hypothetical protein